MSGMRVVFTPLPGQTYQASIRKLSQGQPPTQVKDVQVSKSASTDVTTTFSGGAGESYFMQLFPSGGARAISGTATFSSDVTLTFGALYTVFDEG
ncbi:hypothetical protein NR800_09265 [Corallococcus interemptor]|uniref:hypothetical protein n=1 Tax=Corallococcus TaxID=83461 RepID=UPI001CC11346|nr:MULTISPECIES: hypothetical protein [unclassified Corallococcus]MBZ4334466.1 hypothetical protein [Corallococcus sp. AS-1-12]MBZ4374631.1 hypothetical protein [Corallococcus sp. AS-1-6]